MSNERIQNFRAHIQGATYLSEDAARDVDNLIEILDELGVRMAELTKRWALRELPKPTYEETLARALNTLRGELSSSSRDASWQLLTWAKKTIDDLLAFLRTASLVGLENEDFRYLDDVPVIETLRDFDERLESLAKVVDRDLDDESLRRRTQLALERAESAAEKATTASEKASDAAGMSGNASLSGHFATYANGERAAANAFRVLTIFAVIAGLTGVLLIGPLDSADWAGLTYRIAIAAAAAALATYLGRQAGQHRRMYNWAKSLEVQLQSFPAFVEPIDDDDRVEIYRTFARRVLSAPPEKRTEPSEDSVGVAQLLDLMTALSKRAPG